MKQTYHSQSKTDVNYRSETNKSSISNAELSVKYGVSTNTNFYNLHRRHGGLRKELKVKTPFDAIEKWFAIKPEIFMCTPLEFKVK